MAVVVALLAPGVALAADDPLLGDQWALSDPAAIGAAEALTQSTGAGVLVAVLDTGVQLDHPDLAANIWTNPGEIAGNGSDDDHDGFVDDVHGANMFDLSGNVADDNGHGTHVAGIVAALRGNGAGGAGLAPEAKILAVKVLDHEMAGDTDTLARGIRYAVDRGARILSVSVNSDYPSDEVKSAVRYAGEHGAIVVSSAGNNGRNIDLFPSYAASLSDPAIFSVAAFDREARLWAQSNTGLISVDLSAPGVRIVSTTFKSTYQSRTGTSVAAPLVAASLALLSAARPDLSIGALRDAIMRTTNRKDVAQRLLVPGGRLDVGAAMHDVLAGRTWRASPPGQTNAATLRLRSQTGVRAGTRVRLRWSATGAERVTSWRVSLDGRVVGRVGAARTGFSQRIARSGRHTWRLVGFAGGAVKVVAGRRTFRILARH